MLRPTPPGPVRGITLGSALVVALLAMLTALVVVPASAGPLEPVARASKPKVAVKKGAYGGQSAAYDPVDGSTDPLSFRVAKHRYVTSFHVMFACPIPGGAVYHRLEPAPIKADRRGRFVVTWHPWDQQSVTATISGRLTATGKVKKGIISVSHSTCSRTAPWKAKRVRHHG